MAEGDYKLRYLPLFYEDLSEKINYICDKLENPLAAKKLLDTVENGLSCCD